MLGPSVFTLFTHIMNFTVYRERPLTGRFKNLMMVMVMVLMMMVLMIMMMMMTMMMVTTMMMAVVVWLRMYRERKHTG